MLGTGTPIRVAPGATDAGATVTPTDAAAGGTTVPGGGPAGGAATVEVLE